MTAKEFMTSLFRRSAIQACVGIETAAAPITAVGLYVLTYAPNIQNITVTAVAAVVSGLAAYGLHKLYQTRPSPWFRLNL